MPRRKVKPQIRADSGAYRRTFTDDPQHDRLRGGRRGAARRCRSPSSCARVNHRYLDLTVRLPDELRALEPRCASASPRELKRGKVECRVALNRSSARRRRARGRRRARRAARRRGRRGRAPRCPDAPPLTTADDPALARRAGRAVGRRRGARRREVARLVDTALRDLAAARGARRRQARSAMLEACCDGIEAQVARVAPRVPAIHAAYVEKLGGAPARGRPRPQRGAAEAGARAVRHQGRRGRGGRAAGHARAEVRRVLARAAAPASGSTSSPRSSTARRTRSARSRSTPRCRRSSLELKVLIEQMREQVQNIE